MKKSSRFSYRVPRDMRQPRHLLFQIAQLGDIPHGAVEDLFLSLAVQIIKMHIKGSQCAVGFIEMQQSLGAVESVALRQTQQLGDPRDIRLGQKPLDAGQTIFEIRYVDRLIELFVIAHDIHIVTVPRVQRARPRMLLSMVSL